MDKEVWRQKPLPLLTILKWHFVFCDVTMMLLSTYVVAVLVTLKPDSTLNVEI